MQRQVRVLSVVGRVELGDVRVGAARLSIKNVHTFMNHDSSSRIGADPVAEMGIDIGESRAEGDGPVQGSFRSRC